MCKLQPMMLSLLAGAFMGLAAYAVLLLTASPWEESLAAALIGSVAGVIALEKRLAIIGAVACVLGWVAGIVLFGVLIELGVGAWILAGAGLGTAAGIYSKSWWRVMAGSVLGFLAGFISEASRFLPVFAQSLRSFDMQLLLLLTAGTLCPLTAMLVGTSRAQK